MPGWNDLFVRDSPADIGTVPSPGYPYTSPDVICTQQTTYANPASVFGTSSSWSQDPCRAALAQNINYFYFRAKNLGTDPTGGRMYLYWMPVTLAALPGAWINNPMYVQPPPPSPGAPQPPQQNYCDVPSVGQNGITVTPLPFIWNAGTTNIHYCTVGICSTAAHPWNSQPPAFSSWDDFTLWVRNNQNVCWRNLQLMTNPNAPEWDTVQAFSNSFSTDVPLLLVVTCTNVPPNTVITLTSTPLGLNQSITVTSPNGTYYAQGVTCPAGFSGYVETKAQAPSGTSWGNATITTAAWVGSSNTTHPAARFDGVFEGGVIDRSHPNVAAVYEMMGGGTLLAVGTNSMATAPAQDLVAEGAGQ